MYSNRESLYIFNLEGILLFSPNTHTGTTAQVVGIGLFFFIIIIKDTL